MKKYNAIIIDDEKNLRDALQFMLHQFCPEIYICGTASSAGEGRGLIKDLEVDIIFLDISMPQEDGFAFLRTIPKENYALIFTTAHEEYALRAIKANAIDYLLKPVNPLELREAVSKAVQNYELRYSRPDARRVYSQSLNNLQEQIQSTDKTTKKITVADQYGFKVVEVDRIMYLQADSNYTILNLSGLEKIVVTRSLGEFEKILDDSVFFRIHKSSIINMNYLKAYSSFEGNFAELSDGTKLTISRRKLNEFREAVARFSKSIG